MKFLPIVLVSIQFIIPTLTASIQLPDYIKTCSKSEKNYFKCFAKNAKEALLKLADGEPLLNIPPLDPLQLEEVKLNQGTSQVGITLIVHKPKIRKTSTAEFLDSTKIDIKNKHFRIGFRAPELILEGTYTAGGRVLILPITGNGDIHVTLYNLTSVFNVDYDLYKKDGRDHAKFRNPKFDVVSHGKAIFDLKNLFNGDKTLGSNMNAVINENWQVIAADLIPALRETLEVFVNDILSNIFDKVAFDDIIPD